MLQSKSMLHCDRFLEQLETTDDTKQFARELIDGTLTFRKQIDRTLRMNLDRWKLNRLNFVVQNILRLAVFEMCYHKQSSHQVVINEAIELCKDFVDDSSHGLVNSVLQKLYDEIQNPEKASSEKPDKNTAVSCESTSLEETTG
jgi:transcription antitermination factor NusB